MYTGKYATTSEVEEPRYLSDEESRMIDTPHYNKWHRQQTRHYHRSGKRSKRESSTESEDYSSTSPSARSHRYSTPEHDRSVGDAQKGRDETEDPDEAGYESAGDDQRRERENLDPGKRSEARASARREADQEPLTKKDVSTAKKP